MWNSNIKAILSVQTCYISALPKVKASRSVHAKIWKCEFYLRFKNKSNQYKLLKSRFSLRIYWLNYHNYLFQHYQKLRHHVETVHAKHKPWKCEFCEYRHAKHWGINEHMKNVHKKSSEQPSPYGVKRGRPPGTKNFDETKLTHGPGVCPHCDKVGIKGIVL